MSGICGISWPPRSLRGLVLFGQRAVVVLLAVVFLGWLAWRERVSEPLVRLAVALIGIAALVAP